jgi:hypothetical protein
MTRNSSTTLNKSGDSGYTFWLLKFRGNVFIIIVSGSIFSFNLRCVCFMKWEILVFGAYIFIIVISFCCIVPFVII